METSMAINCPTVDCDPTSDARAVVASKSTPVNSKLHNRKLTRNNIKFFRVSIAFSSKVSMDQL
jgi:hypothetical protein